MDGCYYITTSNCRTACKGRGIRDPLHSLSNKPPIDTDKHELKSSVFICVYPWFIEDIWNRCTSVESTVKCRIKSITTIQNRSIIEN
jgi:hypothetical protein